MRRTHRFLWNGKTIEQEETFYLVRANKFDPTAEVALTESEMLDFQETCWWPVTELEKSSEEFAPRRFPSLLRQLLKQGVPAQPIDVGI